MRIGFTGTRKGMTRLQAFRLVEILSNKGAEALHHGDCIGADAEADTIARLLCINPITTIAHPPSDVRFRANCNSDVVHPPRDYHDRNKDIVKAAHLLIACPAGKESRRSGTWYTVRYARKVNKPRIIIWPNGDIEHEGV